MTASAKTLARRASSGPVARIADTAARMVAAAYRTRAARRTMTQLSRLDDRTLKDIGLRRGEIESLALGFGFDRSRHHR